MKWFVLSLIFWRFSHFSDLLKLKSFTRCWTLQTKSSKWKHCKYLLINCWRSVWKKSKVANLCLVKIWLSSAIFMWSSFLLFMALMVIKRVIFGKMKVLSKFERFIPVLFYWLASLCWIIFSGLSARMMNSFFDLVLCHFRWGQRKKMCV